MATDRVPARPGPWGAGVGTARRWLWSCFNGRVGRSACQTPARVPPASPDEDAGAPSPTEHSHRVAVGGPSVARTRPDQHVRAAAVPRQQPRGRDKSA